MLLTLLCCLFSHAIPAEEVPLRSARAVAESLASHIPAERPFELTARITYIRRLGAIGALGVEDETGCVAMTVNDCRTIRSLTPGDTAVLHGIVEPFSRERNQICLKNFTFLRHGSVPTPVSASISDLLDGKFDFRLVRITGLSRDAVTSETHPDWIILVIHSGRDHIYVSVPKTPTVTDLDHLVGRHVSAVGICLPTDTSPRDLVGPTFKVAAPEDVVPDKADLADESKLPDISDIHSTSPADILSLGRHRALGKIIAVWNGTSAILKTASGDTVGLSFASKTVPSCGQTVQVVGLPESDLYRINLTRASWSPASGLSIPDEPPVDVSLDMIIPDRPSTPQVSSLYFGKTVRLSGEVLSIPDSERGGPLLLKAGSRVCAVAVCGCDASAKSVSVGCIIDVCGVCVLTSADAHHPSRFPRLDSFLLVTRTPDDIVIRSRPPWWTPLRLCVVLGILLAVLAAILIWNATLRRLVARKSTALLKMQVAKLRETLKIDERTRLAAELHDYLAQNLTVVSYQISAAESALQQGRPDAREFLNNADRMLQSCRLDLRRCLWDLKNDALDEPNFTQAILKTVAPVAQDAALAVRFNVRRSQLNDSTAHAILSICRELVSNAVRHGKAQAVRIAGELKDATIRFSVRDDGCGFDMASRAGQDTGHFGLDGIAERINRLNGTFRIESTPGHGTRVVITMNNETHA